MDDSLPWEFRNPRYVSSLQAEIAHNNLAGMPMEPQERLSSERNNTNFDYISATTHPGGSNPLPRVHQMLDTNLLWATSIPIPVTPTGSESELQTTGADLQLYTVHSQQETNEPSTTRRRMQNRQAQRRFRERKEERQQQLEQAAASLEQRCEELSEKYKGKSQELSEILKEKQTLTAELEDLRKNWRLVLLLLQQPNGPQALTSFLGSGGGSGESKQAGDPAPDANPTLSMGDLLDCLHALASTDNKAPKAN